MSHLRSDPKMMISLLEPKLGPYLWYTRYPSCYCSLLDLTWPLSWIVLIFVLIFGNQGGSTTGNDSTPSLGLGRVNSIWEGTTFMEIWPFSSRRCQTWCRLRQRAWKLGNQNIQILKASSVKMSIVWYPKFVLAKNIFYLYQ